MTPLRRGVMARQPGGRGAERFSDPAGYEAGLHALVARGFQVSAVQILARKRSRPALMATCA